MLDRAVGKFPISITAILRRIVPSHQPVDSWAALIMQVACPHCSRVLEFTGDAPSFCAYCGKTLGAAATSTADQIAQQATRPFIAGEQPAPAAPLTTLGGYQILRRLGGGGMGSVYEAQEAVTGQRVAVKVIAPEFARSQVAVERFRQEGRLASLISHPRCVFVLAAEEEAGRPYIVMELMPGSNLQELVEKNGPLPIQDAIAKILDVIDGLQEAHRLGVIHRDVKPSNCFLLDDGRVKVGDFGLSKSLVNSADLTKTGTFLGTLLYAAPEQIKGERLDVRTDVYAVAATLYFLLAGQAPFQAKDPAATLARTIADPPTPLRSLRPEVSPALVKVIVRGLERNPDRRYRNLDDFRTALMRFVPSSLSIGAMGLRAGAIVIDGLIHGLLSLVLLRVVGATILEDSLAVTWLASLGMFAYFSILEGIWGLTLGKWLLRLRVCTSKGNEAPGILRASWRTLVFYALVALVSDLMSLAPAPEDELTGAQLLAFFSVPAGILILISSMRARNGYRGLHELASGTRVVRLPWPRKREVFTSRRPVPWLEKLDRPDDLPATIGPFAIRGALPAKGVDKVLLGEDTALGRKVVIYCRPSTAAGLERARRNLHRPTRLRWLSGGLQEALAWDAFLAPSGCPLEEVCDRDHPMSWRSFRGILEQLVDESTAACADGTLPAPLTLDQIWIQPNGRVQLLDSPLQPRSPTDIPVTEYDPQERALRLLRQASQLALEGGVRARAHVVRAPAPEHAGKILERLLGGPDAYRTAAELQADLAATHDRPAEVNLTLRAAHLVLLAVALFFPLLIMFGPIGVLATTNLVTDAFAQPREPVDSRNVMIFLAFGAIMLVFFWPILWVFWAFFFRGGITQHMMGLTLVGRNGRIASRLRCAWRALLVWLPVLILLTASVGVKTADMQARAAPLALFWTAVAYLVGCVALALWQPSRSLHDRIAGTHLVPK